MHPDTKELSEPVQCLWDNCSKSFINSRRCLEHVRKHHSLSTRVCLWKGCTFEQTYSQEASLRHHIKKHFLLIESICRVCENEVLFKWRFDLTKHIKRFHVNHRHTIEIQRIDGFDVHIAVKDEIAVPPDLKFLLN